MAVHGVLHPAPSVPLGRAADDGNRPRGLHGLLARGSQRIEIVSVRSDRVEAKGRELFGERLQAKDVFRSSEPLDPVSINEPDHIPQVVVGDEERRFPDRSLVEFTIAHDDGLYHQNWEQADIILAGVSRTSKTPTSIYLANRGYKTANIPLVPESPPPAALYNLKRPMVVGLVTSADRLVQVRRNRLLSLNQAPDTDYVDEDKVKAEISYARRIFADNGWPVIDVTRRSIEESAAAIINLFNERQGRILEQTP